MILKLSERAQAIVRALLLAGFVATWFGVALWEHGPRAFWTGFFPLVPITLVLIGYHSWRTVCPLAAFAKLGLRVPRAKQRRVGAFFEKYSYLVSLSVLAFCLAVRLLFINGDGIALGIFLALISLAAFVTGAVYTGKTWCNFFCPIGIVEKIYTEPANLYAHGNSQCAKCTACKKHCPDIDEENHYWKEFDSSARRVAYYAFPGLVWGFYTAYALPRGTIQDYFSGAWTHTPRQYELATAPGLFFAEAVPRLASVPVFLLLTMGLSYFAFLGMEKLLARWIEAKRAHHVSLTLAAWAAFTSFYVFAGQPTYRRIGGLPTVAGILTVLVGTLMLARRWMRNEEDYVQERSVKKVLAKWPYDEPPPRDWRMVFAFVKSKERERDKVLAVYADAVREVLADGVVDASEQKLLDKLRSEFGITKAEHEKVFARLSEEDRALFDPSKAQSIEQRAQMAGYRLALQSLLAARPRDQELEELRSSYGIDRATHVKILAELRSADSPLRQRVTEQLARIDELRQTLADAAALSRIRAFQLLFLVLLRRQSAAVARALELLGITVDDTKRLHLLNTKLFADSVETRRTGLAELTVLDAEVARRLEPAVMVRRPPATKVVDPARLNTALDALMNGADPILAAAALVAAGVSNANGIAPRLAQYAQHNHPLVREACAVAAGVGGSDTQANVLEILAQDPDPHVRATASVLAQAAPDATGRKGLAGQVTTRAAENMIATLRTGEVRADAAGFAELPTPERMLTLATIPLFVDLEPEHLYEIATLATERVLAADENLCREGEPGDEVYVVIAGKGEVSVGEGDARNVVSQVKSGDCVGELAVLDEAPRAATVRAGEPMRVLAIQGTAFRSLLSREPELAVAVVSMVTKRLRGTLARAAGSMSNPGVRTSGVQWDKGA